VPTCTSKGKREGDAESYLHRIGRAGRFGAAGIALTLYDRDEDE
jgi:superfamily II DNA/RNA helicase